jgi:DNA-binding CsgD family transcriptional regulator
VVVSPVSLTLSSSDLAQLEHCLQVLLSPLAHGAIEEWRTASRKAVERLIGADSSAFILPLSGEPFISAPRELLPAQLAYEQYFHSCDFVLTRRRLELGLEVYHRDMLYQPGEVDHDELYQDWCIPYRLHDTLGMGFQIDGGPFPAGIHFYHEEAGTKSFGDRGVALLRLLLPAFKAGVVTCIRHARHRAGLERMLDGLAEPMALLGTKGCLLHANIAMGRMLAGDAEARRVEEELKRLAQAVGEIGRQHGKAGRLALPVSGTREVRTASQRYRLTGTLLGSGPGADGPVLVSLRAVQGHGLTNDDLRSRFGLTTREIQVARLLAAGRSNAEITRALSVSAHTARRHTERVRAKLGVPTRTAVAARLHGTVEP